MSDFTRIETQDELDRIIKARLARVVAHSRQWEGRAKQNNSDAETYRREARKWERLAKENLAVIQAHERTITKFIDRLDDVLNED